MSGHGLVKRRMHLFTSHNDPKAEGVAYGLCLRAALSPETNIAMMVEIGTDEAEMYQI